MNDLTKIVVYISAFSLGTSLMAFEILVSRLLKPDFGSGIYTWSSLISVVLMAMMCGYFLGGYLVDRYPTLRLGAVFAAIAGVWFAILPMFSSDLTAWVSNLIFDEVKGVMVASFLLQFIPIAALGAFSPIAIRIRLLSVERAGRTAGVIYAISTTGNVVGVLGAALFLIPNFATSTSIYGLSVICLSVAVVLWLVAAETPERVAPRAA